MTTIAAAVTATPTTNGNGNDSHKKNRIQVSNTKKPLFFYVNLAKVCNNNAFPYYFYDFIFLQIEPTLIILLLSLKFEM